MMMTMMQKSMHEEGAPRGSPMKRMTPVKPKPPVNPKPPKSRECGMGMGLGLDWPALDFTQMMTAFAPSSFGVHTEAAAEAAEAVAAAEARALKASASVEKVKAGAAVWAALAQEAQDTQEAELKTSILTPRHQMLAVEDTLAVIEQSASRNGERDVAGVEAGAEGETTEVEAAAEEARAMAASVEKVEAGAASARVNARQQHAQAVDELDVLSERSNLTPRLEETLEVATSVAAADVPIVPPEVMQAADAASAARVLSASTLAEKVSDDSLHTRQRRALESTQDTLRTSSRLDHTVPSAEHASTIHPQRWRKPSLGGYGLTGQRTVPSQYPPSRVGWAGYKVRRAPRS